MSETALSEMTANGHEEVTDHDLDRLLAKLAQIGGEASRWRKHRRAMLQTNQDSVELNLAQHAFLRALLAFSDDPAWMSRVKAWHEADEALFKLIGRHGQSEE